MAEFEREKQALLLAMDADKGFKHFTDALDALKALRSDPDIARKAIDKWGERALEYLTEALDRKEIRHYAFDKIGEDTLDHLSTASCEDPMVYLEARARGYAPEKYGCSLFQEDWADIREAYEKTQPLFAPQNDPSTTATALQHNGRAVNLEEELELGHS
jgi:hypothetical protein